MSWDGKLFQRHLLTRRFGREMAWHEELESTNFWLAENHAQFTMSGGVAAANHQTRGRGRYERTWLDTPGSSLLFSVLLRHPANAEVGYLSLMPAIALAEVLFEHWGEQHKVGVKWPNDVQLNERKVAGILGQTSSQGVAAVSVVGMGVNVGELPVALLEEVKLHATSIHAETGETLSREILLAEILNHWEPLFDLFLEQRFGELRERWERFGPVRGALLTRREGKATISGHYEGLGEHGQLQIRDVQDRVIEVFTGDIEA